jgi:hypothetical protein
MSSRYKIVFQDVVVDVRKKHFDSAYRRIEGFGSIKNPYLSRARYLVHSNKHSPYYDDDASRENLDMLDSASDPWGQAEKGRCLILGDFYDADTALAEDILIKAGDDPKAMYYIAYINDMEMHVDGGGEKFGDKQHALELYRQVMDKGGQYKNLAALAFCRIMIKSGDMSLEHKSKVFSVLVGLSNQTGSEADKLLAKFMLLELGDLFSSIYSESNAPNTMVEKIEFESEHRDAVSSLESLSLFIAG